MSADMNIILVHGAWADGSSWSRVIPNLQRAGFNVTGVPIPLSSLADDVAKTQAVLHRVVKSHPAPTLLVAHSWGGAVITAAGNDPNVVGLVYVAAFAPDSGESVGTLNARFPAEPVVARLIGPDEQGFLWIDPADYLRYFAPDIAPNDARVMSVTQRPLAAATFANTVEHAAWHAKPSWFLVAETDQIINPDLERWMAQRAGAELHSVRSSHVAMLARPQVVIELIERAAAATTVAAAH